MATYRGKAPLTMATLLTGRTVYIYRGDLVPADITPFDLNRFLKDGFLEEVVLEEVIVAEALAVPVPPVAPSAPPVVDGVTNPAADPVTPLEGEVPESTEPARPLRSAPKDDWVAWAVKHGADPAEAEASTKQVLVETYGA